MATKRLAHPSAQNKIQECITNKKNFLLSGGAGSGKTHSLVDALKYIYANDHDARVACITFTNVAADEIRERAPYDRLWVSTIHDFLWQEIKPYQKNLRAKFLELFRDEESPETSNIESISYRNYIDYENGVISHNDLIKISREMYKSYPTLCKILCDKYDYIFIDEYQDTDPAIMEIFLSHIESFAKGKTCIGMFGDAMQAIYDSGVEASSNGMAEFDGKFEHIKKENNYRCSKEVIDLINKVRSDDIVQKPAKNNLPGMVKFLYSSQHIPLGQLKLANVFNDWNFEDPSGTKILMLTHRLIAENSDESFSNLLKAYRDGNSRQELLTGNEPDQLAQLLLRLADFYSSYKNRKYAHTISDLIDIKIINNTIKQKIMRILTRIDSQVSSLTIGDVVSMVEHDRVIQCGNIREGIEDRFDRVMKLPFIEALHYFDYRNGHSPFSTQHSVKGAEYDDVLVILDNGKWNNYNFESLFSTSTSNQRIAERTKKLFYVCCSRAKNNLIVYMSTSSTSVIDGAKKLFGEENTMKLD